MKRTLTFFVCCLAFIQTAHLRAETYTDYQTASGVLRDLIKFDWTSLDDGRNWAILRGIRAKLSTEEFRKLPGLTDPSYVTPEQSDTRAGTAEVVSVLSGKVAGKKWPFLWQRRRDHQTSLQSPPLGPPPFYQPFGRPELAICTVEPGPDGWRRIDPVCLIPEDWLKSVESARDFLKSHATEFAPKDARAVAALSKLLADPNPFIACAACKAIIAHTDDSVPAAIYEQIAKSTGMRQAFFVYVVLDGLKPPPDAQGRKVTEKLGLLIDSLDSPDALRGIALGSSAHLFPAFRANPFDWPDFRVLQRVEGRYLQIQSHFKPDPYLYEATGAIRTARWLAELRIDPHKAIEEHQKAPGETQNPNIVAPPSR